MRIRILLALILAAAGLAGCGGGPKLVEVSGTVKLDGQPFGGALVEFMPDPANKEVVGGSAVTGAAGDYVLRSDGRSGGAPGKYTVTITRAGAGAAGAPAPENDPGQRAAMKAAGGPEAAKKAAAPGPSGSFPAEVPEAGTDSLNFDVKSK